MPRDAGRAIGDVAGPARRLTGSGASPVDVERLEEQLRQLQKVDVMGRLSAGIAHDFNNILTAIMGYADLLETSADSSAQARADVAEIRRAAERAASLTRQILAFSRSETRHIGLVDLNIVVTDMARMLRRVVGEDIDLVVECEPIPWKTRADVGQLEQVLLNLVVNARDAMPSGGRLSIATRHLAAADTLPSTPPEIPAGDYILLEVTDEGVGMTEAVRARIFEPFFTTKEPGRGTGLGLAMVASIIHDSDGHILVESAQGHGTRFSIFLPVAEEPVSVTPVLPGDRRRLDGSATVLLVEDEPQVRSLAALWLQRYGYAVHAASDGEDALTRTASEALTPDLLVTDLVMPSLGGGPLAASLRHVFPSLRVLYMSGYTNRAEIESQLTQRGVGFLQKPFSPARLLSAVRTLLVWPGPERRNPGGCDPLSRLSSNDAHVFRQQITG